MNPISIVSAHFGFAYRGFREQGVWKHNQVDRESSVQRSGLPEIFITRSLRRGKFAIEPLSQGAIGFLHKPFDAADLLGAIELALVPPVEA